MRKVTLISEPRDHVNVHATVRNAGNGLLLLTRPTVYRPCPKLIRRKKVAWSSPLDLRQGIEPGISWLVVRDLTNCANLAHSHVFMSCTTGCKSWWSDNRIWQAPSEYARKNLNYWSKIHTTPAQHGKWTTCASQHNPEWTARNKAGRPTQHPPILGHMPWTGSTWWSDILGCENVDTAHLETSHALNHSWDTSGHCEV